MIVAEQKPLSELKTLIDSAEKVLVVGCGTCVTVCFAGGSREAAITAASLRMSSKLDGNGRQVTDVTVQRQCEWEYLDQIAEQVEGADIVLSLGCGIGVQAIAEHFPQSWVVPGLNTIFPGFADGAGSVGRALCRLRRLRTWADRRHLPDRPLLQIAAERSLRRVGGGSLRDQPGDRVCLAADLRPSEQQG